MKTWMKFADAWGAVMTTLIFALGYLTIFSLFSPWLRKKDPLRLKRRATGSFWIERAEARVTRESMRRLG